MDAGTVTAATATEKSDRLQRCLSWVQDCKRAVNELRGDVKAAISNREKCCMVLSTAMAACLALESLVYSGKVDSTKEQQLQRLCAKVTSTVDLAGARVKVYGQQSRLQKYCKFFRKQHTIDKFDAVISQLDEHSEKAWQLADSNNHMPVRRRGVRASFSQGLQTTSVSAAADSSMFDSAECANNKDAQLYHEAPLARCRLRRGTRHNGVRCMVFINPETSMHAGTLGHVWWYIAGAVGGNLYMHDLASSAVHELEDARKEPPVSTMHHDAQGHVWLGHKGGVVRVWSDSSLTPVTLPIRCFHADIRVIVCDGQGAARVGSDSGNVKRIELHRKQTTDGNTKLWLEHTHTLRHPAKSRRSSIVFSSTASAELDDLSRADSAHASEDDSATEDPGPGTAGVRAHSGPVTAVETYRNFVFTSGGTHSSCALHQWTQNGMLHHSHKLKELGVARAIRALSPIVHVRVPVSMARQRSSNTGLENLDISSLSSVGTQSPVDSTEAVSNRRQTDWQILTAHDNGQVQVWDMSAGTLHPVLKIGAAGSSARCLVVCKTLGVFATAHADGKLYLRLLPHLQVGEGSTVTVGEPVQTLTNDSSAVIQAHRSSMVSAINANSGIITCGIFGSIMWWPEAELRSCVESAGMRLSSEERRSIKAGQESPRAAMSKVLRRYFTPSSAALAQATLEHMRSSGDLQRSDIATDLTSTQLQDSASLEDGSQPVALDHVASEQGTSSSRQDMSSSGLKRLPSSGPAAQQFIVEVNRILEEGTAQQMTYQEMTGKIARAASVTNLPSPGRDSQQGTNSARSSTETASSAEFPGPACGPLEVAPILSGSPRQHRAANGMQAPPPGASHPHASAKPQSSLPTDAATEQPPFTMARLNEHDAQHSAQLEVESQLGILHNSGACQELLQTPLAPLQKSVSMDRSPHMQKEALKMLQQIQRSSSSSSVPKVPNSFPGSLSDKEGAAFRRPAGLLAEAGTIGRGSGSSLSSSIFGESNQWVIDYNDLTFRKVIGEGSIGRVHLGRWQETDVAIKVLGHVPTQSSLPVAAPMHSTGQMSAIDEGDSGEEVSDQDDDELLDSSMALTIKTLEREVSIMAAIRHPNVVLFMGVCLDPPCMVTEFCARGSMFDVLAKARSSPRLAQQLDWPKRVSMALDAAKGMLQLHSHKPPILHRDLKSPNLLVDKHWRVKIADFNLSRVMEAQAVVSSISANNPRWLAPEVVTDQAYSTAADVYSFGLILWELLTWQLPWADLGPFQMMVAIAEKQRRPSIPPESELPGGSFLGLPVYLELMEACWHAEAEERPSFESCIITLRGLLEQAMAVKSQQKAAGQKTSSPKQQAGTSPFGQSAQGSAPSAPTPSQVAASDSGPGRTGAPDGHPQLALTSAGSQPPGSMHAGPPNMQELQQNLLRPATHPAARLQAAADPGAAQGPPRDQPDSFRQHQLPDHGASSPQTSTGYTSQGPARYSPQNQSPAHIRSRDALLALQSQAPRDSSDQQLPVLSILEQREAARQSLQEPPGSSNQEHEQSDAEAHYQQSAPVAAPVGRSLQRPGHDMFPGDLTDKDSNDGHDRPPQPSMHTWQPEGMNGLPAGEANNASSQAGASYQPPARRPMHMRPRQSIDALHTQGNSSTHMSPFAGFAALTMARTSMDDRQDHRAPATKSVRASLEQVVGKNKIMKTVPGHIRRSLDAGPGGRKSLEFQQPPPASSSGMRNSRDGKNVQSAEEASTRWTEEGRCKSLEASQQPQHQEQVPQGNTEDLSTIRETPSNPSSTDNDALSAQRPEP